MKTWIKVNLNKITLLLALTDAITGVAGLIIASIAHHKANDLSYSLDLNDKQVICWSSTTWETKDKSHIKHIYIYVSTAENNNDSKWNDIYPNKILINKFYNNN